MPPAVAPRAAQEANPFAPGKMSFSSRPSCRTGLEVSLESARRPLFGSPLTSCSVTSQELPGDDGVHPALSVVCGPRRQAAHSQGAADHDVTVGSRQRGVGVQSLTYSGNARCLDRKSFRKRCCRDHRIASRQSRFRLLLTSGAIRRRVAITRTTGRRSNAIVPRSTTVVRTSTTQTDGWLARWTHTANPRPCMASRIRPQRCSHTRLDRWCQIMGFVLCPKRRFSLLT